VPTSQIPTAYTYTNIADFSRGFQGFELTARKRFSNRWQVNGSYSYNDAPMHFDSTRGYAWWSERSDPTNIENSLNHGQYAPESTSSGLGNVFINAKWIFRVSGSYTLPLWDDWRRSTTRGTATHIREVLSLTARSAPDDRRSSGQGGEERLPNFQTVDFRVDKPFTMFARWGDRRVDIFNITNGNTRCLMRADKTPTANTISQLTAPRVVRFGIRTTVNQGFRRVVPKVVRQVRQRKGAAPSGAPLFYCRLPDLTDLTIE
jgi:hypothetical protein